MEISRRRLGIYGAIALTIIIIITLVLAPTNNKLNQGSTYSRSPDGYGAWYEFMSKRGTPVQRWQKPFQDLVKNQNTQSPITLLQIYAQLPFIGLSQAEHNWLKKGNTLVILGVYQPATKAPFSTLQDSLVGKVKIETSRRSKNTKKLLGDNFGSIVWEEKIGQGKAIFATASYLAANAYQDSSENYEFLAQLVTGLKIEGSSTINFLRNSEILVEKKNRIEEKVNYTRERIQNQIWVDEYIHGYKDPEVINREISKNLIGYLVQKPIFIALVQGLILLLVAIWAGNCRFGKPISVSAPVIDNSNAYIQALANILHKAEKSEFILEILGKEEQRQLQRILGLGDSLLDRQSLVKIWVQQTGRSATELQPFLQSQSHNRPISETDLLTWLDKCEQIRKIGTREQV